MVYNMRINTVKKHKLKNQAARQKHYVQTLFKLELHIICWKVAVQQDVLSVRELSEIT